MGQSQSVNEKSKQQPLKPKKTFGLVYFQRFYDACIKGTREERTLFQYQKEKQKPLEAIFRQWKERPEVQEKCQKMGVNVNGYWLNHGGKAEETKKYDELYKKEKMDKIRPTINISEQQHYQDLHETFLDAELMYKFMEEVICHDVSDISIMSTMRDYQRLAKKPAYQGDFLKQMFMWNELDEQSKYHIRLVQEHYQNNRPDGPETWNSWERDCKKIKYKTQQIVKKKAMEDVVRKIEEFKKFEEDKDRPDLMPFKFNNENFWKKKECPLRAQLHYKMHPMIFLKQELPAYEKIQNNWIYQMLDESTKKQFLQSRRPNYLHPDFQTYQEYINEIVKYSGAHKDEEVLSIQLFACHGAVLNGCQIAFINEYDKDNKFYKYIMVENYLRSLKNQANVESIYFLVLFASCRESFISGVKNNIKNEEMKDGQMLDVEPSRGAKEDQGISNAKISNFTFIFGCDPALGMSADTKFVKLFIDHLKGIFSPQDGSVLIPDCLGTIDSINENVNFESTSSNLGRVLQLFRQDNRVSTRHLIVLNKDEYITKENEDKILVKKDLKDFQVAFKSCTKKTQYFINFLINEIGFEKDEVLFIGEEEARQIEVLMNESQIFKVYNKDLTTENKLREFAQRTFNSKSLSNGRQLLTIFLNESDQTEVQDFIINRNPELALNIVKFENKTSENDDLNSEFFSYWKDEEHQMRTYLAEARENIKHLNNITFENLHRFFQNLPRVVTFCAYNRQFKPGSGQFDIIYDLKEKTNQTIKPKFDYLENLPVRVKKTSRFSLGFKFDSGNSNVYEECVTIIELKKSKNQNEKREPNKIKEERKIAENPSIKQSGFQRLESRIIQNADLLHEKDEKPKVNYKIVAYVVSRGKKKKKIKDGKNEFKMEFKLELDEDEEVHELKKLYEQDTQGHEELFFAIICKQQSKARICKVSLITLEDDTKDPVEKIKKPVIAFKEQVLVTKAKKRHNGKDENDYDQENGTKLQQFYHEEVIDKFKRRIFFSSSCWNSIKLIVKLRDIEKTDEFPFRKDIQVVIDRYHFSVHATKDNKNKNSDLFIYMFTNRKEQNNTQSPIEIEVFKWGDDNNKKDLELTTERRYLKDFILQNNQSESNARGFYSVREDSTKIIMSAEETNDDQEFENKDFVEELWKKQAASFFESSDSPQRLIFCCGSRSNYVYDLKLENGLIKLYSQKEIDLGRAIGLQKKPFVRQIDLIEHDFISFITNSKEAKYKKTTDLNDKKLGNLKETQITSLPEMLKMPCDCYEERNNQEIEDSLDFKVGEEGKESEENKDEKKKEGINQNVRVKRNTDHFYFAVAKQHISIVNKVTSEEYKIIQQRAINENDRISGAFLTYYEYFEKDSLNVTVLKKVKQLSLHYFESFFDHKNVLINCAYTIFDMTDDFIDMLIKCGEIIPHTKNQLINRFATLKQMQESDESNLKIPSSLQEVLDKAQRTERQKSLELKEINERHNGNIYCLLDRLNQNYQSIFDKFDAFESSINQPAQNK